MADTDCASESASSICDEERVRRLFQACDANGDGYIDSQDLLAICRELSLEDSLDELMLQLGADAQGRISYEQFLQRRLALRPEIDALKEPAILDTASDNSQGKIDSWEWDSGARDLSPVPQPLAGKIVNNNQFLEPLIQAEFLNTESIDSKVARRDVRSLDAQHTRDSSRDIISTPLRQSNSNQDCWGIRLDTLPETDRGGSHITYVFTDTVERCTGTPSPEQELPAMKQGDISKINNEKQANHAPADTVNIYKHRSDQPLIDGVDAKIIDQSNKKPTDGNNVYKSDSSEDGNNKNDWCKYTHENKFTTSNDWIVVSSHNKKWLTQEVPSRQLDQCQNYAYGQILFKNIPSEHNRPFLNDRLSDIGHCHYPFTISNGGNLERTYDEPCVDLPRSRSWLCCPSSRPVVAQSPQKPMDEPCLERNIITTPPSLHCSENCAKVQQQLDDQAQRYEEQLTELHSVIAELTRKLHQQRVMAITEEDEASEICTSAHDDSITCPLEVSELEPLENDLSDTETKLPLADSPLELPDPKLNTSQHEPNLTSPTKEELDTLKAEILILKSQLTEAQIQLAQSSSTECLKYQKIPSPTTDYAVDNENDGIILSDEKVEVIKSSTVVPVHKASSLSNNSSFSPAAVPKMAERVKLRRATEEDKVSSNDLANTGLSTAVAEHLVGDILRQCDQPERQALEIELRRLSSKLEHSKAQNAVLALTLTDTKEHCDRLSLLCGKYESNAIALRLALGLTDRAIEAYDVLLALLETELSIDQNEQETLDNRAAAEGVAKQLLSHLDTHQNADILLSPWQHSIYPNPTTNSEPWTVEHETRLREHVSRLKQERSTIQGTYVTLESTHLENVPKAPASNQEMRKMDLEMAVLLQELMSLREDKTELVSKMFVLEKEKGSYELKLKYVEGQQKAQSAALKNLQGQLKDTEGLLAIATQNKEQNYSDAEHAQGIELELMQALARESRLKVRLQELVTTLEQVTKNAEARLLEGKELVQDLNQTNSVLVETVDRNYRKYQSRLKKMEHQMLTLVERHTTQVHNLKQRIVELESPHRQINSSGNSETSL